MASFLLSISSFCVPGNNLFLSIPNHILVSVERILSRNTHKKTPTTLCITVMSSVDDRYEEQNDAPGGDVPTGDVKDNSYVSRTGQYEIPVQSDEKPVQDPIDPATADSDETLGMSDDVDTLTISYSKY